MRRYMPFNLEWYIDMKRFIGFIFFLVISVSSFAGDWHQVAFGVSKITLDEVEVEDRLWDFLRSSSNRKFEKRESYTYQYQLRNDNLVRINAMCSVGSTLVLSMYFVVVDDGGSCYFELSYNTETKSFSGLHVNGAG